MHCGYVPDQEPAPPPQRKLVIEPQVDPLKTEKMFTEFVEQLAKRCVLKALSVLKRAHCWAGRSRRSHSTLV